jgi:hypothetical protein
MSNTQSAFGSNGGREFGADEWANAPWRRGACGMGRWTPFEIIAMVLGFIVFWPIGLAILGYKFWQRRNGGPDLQTVAANTWSSARSAMSGGSASRPWSGGSWGRGFAPSTGNRAFDEWKNAELARLEEERRRLEDAHREFSDFVETIRKAKDREEFERFMNERRNRAPGQPGAAY